MVAVDLQTGATALVGGLLYWVIQITTRFISREKNETLEKNDETLGRETKALRGRVNNLEIQVNSMQTEVDILTNADLPRRARESKAFEREVREKWSNE